MSEYLPYNFIKYSSTTKEFTRDIRGESDI